MVNHCYKLFFLILVSEKSGDLLYILFDDQFRKAHFQKDKTLSLNNSIGGSWPRKLAALNSCLEGFDIFRWAALVCLLSFSP